MYPSKDKREDRRNVLLLKLDSLKEQGEALNNSIARVNAELKALEIIDALEGGHD